MVRLMLTNMIINTIIENNNYKNINEKIIYCIFITLIMGLMVFNFQPMVFRSTQVEIINTLKNNKRR